MTSQQWNRLRVGASLLPILAGATTTGCLTASSAQTPTSVPGTSAKDSASGVSIVAPDWCSEITTVGTSPSTFGAIETGDEGVIRLITREQPQFVYSLQGRLLNKVPLKAGETLAISFLARSLKPGKITGVTKLRVGFGKGSPPWDRSFQEEVSLSSEWKRFDMPFTCKNNFAPGEAQMTFTFGFPAQELEIKEVTVSTFGTTITPASLPRTKRYADPVTPAALAEEVSRIVALKKSLAAVPDPSPAEGRTIHVQKSGLASGDGSASRPFATIPQALAIVKPGDTVLVGVGEYREPRGISVKASGRPDAWIKIKAAPGARPKIITSNWSGFEFRGGICYIEVEGFEMQWVPDANLVAENKGVIHGSGIAPMYASHHIRILNNIVHGYGTGGIVTLDCDYIHIEGNVVYDTAKTSPYGGSAISLCRAFDSDDKPGYHNVIRRNVCYDNELKVSVLETSGGNGKALTDGNGIIVDVFQRSRANPLKPHGQDRDGALKPYTGRTLIENNLLYDNGGRGIHIFRSDKVDIINNTCYQNQKTPDMSGGELTAIESKDVVLINNIAVARPGKRANAQDGSSGTLWSHNLIAGSEDILLHDGVMGLDPQFKAPAPDAPPDAFRLVSGSPAIGVGLPGVAPTDDLSGKKRKAGSINLGAF